MMMMMSSSATAAHNRSTTNGVLSQLFQSSNLMGHYLQQWPIVSQLVIGSALIQIVSISSPLFYMIVFDRVFGRQNLNTLDVMAIGLGASYLFDAVLKAFRTMMTHTMNDSIAHNSVKTLLGQVFGLTPNRQMLPLLRQSLEWYSLLNSQIQWMTTFVWQTCLDSLFALILALILFIMDWQLALMAFSPLLPIILITMATQESMKKSFQQTELSQVQFRNKLNEGVHQLESLSVARAKVPFENIVWQLYETEVLPNQSRPLIWRTHLADLQGLLLGLGGLGVLYLGAHKVVETHLSFGIYLAINMFSRQLVGTFQRLGDGFAQWLSLSSKLEQATKDASQLIETNANQTASRLNLTLPSVQGFLEAKTIQFSYMPEMPPTLKHLSLSVPAGAKVALVGRSGSGKSTLLRLFHGALQPQSGQLSLDGYALPDLALDFLHQSVGLVHSQQGIFQGTLKENITLFDDAFSPKEVLDAASLSGLSDLMQSPHGLNLPIMSNGANLSEGQTARILLARSIIRQPAVLLIDDIFSGLEPPVIDAILQQLLIRFRQQTVIVVSHSPQVHRFFDSVVVLEGGQCVETGTVEELLANKNYYYHLYGSGN